MRAPYSCNHCLSFVRGHRLGRWLGPLLRVPDGEATDPVEIRLPGFFAASVNACGWMILRNGRFFARQPRILTVLCDGSIVSGWSRWVYLMRLLTPPVTRLDQSLFDRPFINSSFDAPAKVFRRSGPAGRSAPNGQRNANLRLLAFGVVALIFRLGMDGRFLAMNSLFLAHPQTRPDAFALASVRDVDP